MTQFNETHIESIIAACQKNVAEIAESLNQCFDRQYRIEVGESTMWNPDQAVDVLDGPGLTVAFGVGQQGVLCLIPASMPLPDWYTDPGDSENSRLQTLALEWSMNMLPAEFEAGEFASVASENMKQQVLDSEPAAWAALVELLVYDETAPADESDSAAASSDQPEAAEPDTEGDSTEEASEDAPENEPARPIAKLFLIAAVDRPPFPSKEEAPAPAASSNTPAPSVGAAAAPVRSSPSSIIDQQMQDLPVTVSVRLAEKKIELGQLVTIAPGGLITFNKGCESLLDLYVNNHLYGRGEAIKVGEKFGLKVTEVGIKQEREQRIL
jgi:flagellar motor switch protein FliN/FliY